VRSALGAVSPRVVKGCAAATGPGQFLRKAKETTVKKSHTRQEKIQEQTMEASLALRPVPAAGVNRLKEAGNKKTATERHRKRD